MIYEPVYPRSLDQLNISTTEVLKGQKKGVAKGEELA
jgi:hypothetical protein